MVTVQKILMRVLVDGAKVQWKLVGMGTLPRRDVLHSMYVRINPSHVPSE
jgi:hypothetical protein